MANRGGGDGQVLEVVEAADAGTVASDTGVVENRCDSTELRREIGGIDAAMRCVDDDRTGSFGPNASDAVGDDDGNRDRISLSAYAAAAGSRAWSTSWMPAMMRLRSGKT